MSNENKKSEKTIYKELLQQVTEMYNSADEATKQKLDAYKQTIDNYSAADPMTNRDARRLYIDAYQRMLQIGKGEMGYNPTQLGSAMTNSFGYYSSDEINNIGNQLAYKLFHTQPSNTQTTSSVSSTTTNGNDEYLHHNFVWNEGLNPDYFDSTTTKTHKVHSFIDKLSANLSTAAAKSSNKYAVHGLGTLTPEGISDALNTLSTAKTRNWETPDNNTLESFNKLKELAIKLNIPVDEFQQYFSLGEQESEDPQAEARTAKLKELKLTDATDIDPNAAAYMKKMGWQALTDEDGVTRLYDQNFGLIRTPHSYIQDDFSANDAGFSFFVTNDGQYHIIQDIRPGEDGKFKYDPNDRIFGEQIHSAIQNITDDYGEKAVQWKYSPYSQFYQQNGEQKDYKIQSLLDQVSVKLGNVSNFDFADVSKFFGTNQPVIVALTPDKIKYDMFGRFILPSNTNYYTLDNSGNLIVTTKEKLHEQGYRYNGYGEKKNQIVQGISLDNEIMKYANDPNNRKFYDSDNMYGFRGIGEWWHGAEGLADEIKNDPITWANNIIDCILNPDTTFLQFGDVNFSGQKILNELKYNKNPKKFIQGLFFYLKDQNILNKIDKNKIRQLLIKYSTINSDVQQSVQKGQQGMLIDVHGNKIDSQEEQKQLYTVYSKPSITNTPPKEQEDWIKWTNMGALAADVVSMITAFVPGYGTLASGVLGVGSTISTFSTDLATDGFQGKDLFNLITNLGMDFVGLFGGVGKTGKIVKNIVKMAPTIIGSFQTIANGKNYIQLVEKIQSGQTLSINEWMLLGQGLTAIAGLTRAGASAMHMKRIKNAKTIKAKGVNEEVKFTVKAINDKGKPEEIVLSRKDIEDLGNIAADKSGTAYENLNIGLEALDSKYKDYKIIPDKKPRSLKNPFGRGEADTNPLSHYDFNDPKTQIKGHSAIEVQESIDLLEKYSKAPWYKAMINGEEWSMFGKNKPMKKDGGKINRLYQYINNK